jgi:hypothetical protein
MASYSPTRVNWALFDRSSIMSDIEEAIRRRAYELWEHAGRPEGQSEEFWHAARLELGAKETIEEKIDALGPPIVEPPVIAVQRGAPVGLPGERIVEQGVIDDGIENLLVPARSRKADD